MRVVFAVLTSFVMVSLPACAPIAAILSYSQPTIQIATQLDQSKLVADSLIFAGSGKTVTDHMVSAATGSDCKLLNALAGDPVCTSICR